MEQKHKVTFLKQDYKNSTTGAKVPGVTVLVEGVFRDILDKLIADTNREPDYVQLLQEAMFRGINEMLGEAEKENAKD